jgi:hypothetical protein
MAFLKKMQTGINQLGHDLNSAAEKSVNKTTKEGEQQNETRRGIACTHTVQSAVRHCGSPVIAGVAVFGGTGGGV